MISPSIYNEHKAGQTVYIPPHAVQYIHNPGPGDLVFICIADPAWRAEDEKVIVK